MCTDVHYMIILWHSWHQIYFSTSVFVNEIRTVCGQMTLRHILYFIHLAHNGKKPYMTFEKHSSYTAREKYLPMLDTSASLKTMETRIIIIIVFTKFLVFSHVFCHCMELLYVTTITNRRLFPCYILDRYLPHVSIVVLVCLLRGTQWRSG